MRGDHLGILRHSLGLKRNGRGLAYRNHFVARPGSTDYSACMWLANQGFMERRRGGELTGGDDVFVVTDKGKRLAEARDGGEI